MSPLINMRTGLLAVALFLAGATTAFADGLQQQLPIPIPSSIGGSGALSASATITLLGYGTSITAYADSNYVGNYNSGTGLITPVTPCTYTCTTYLNQSFFSWVSMLTGNRVTRVPNTNNLGVGSDRIVPDMGPSGTNGRLSGLLAAISAAGGPVIVIIQGGDNDVAAGTSCSSITTTLKSIYQPVLATGAVVIRTTIYPRYSPNAFSNTSALVANCVNNFDRQLVGQPGYAGFYLADLDNVMSDPTSTSGWVSAQSGAVLDPDGVHPSMLGGMIIGQVIDNEINALYPSWRQPQQNAGDAYNSTYNPYGNMLVNLAMAGSSGTVSGTGCSGTAATNHTLFCAGNSATMAGSQGVNNDGSANQIITLGGTPGANAQDYFNQIANSGQVVGGMTVVGKMWVNLGVNTGISYIEVCLEMTDNGNSVEQCSGGNLYNATARGTTLPTVGWTGNLLFETPHYTVISATPTNPRLTMYIGYNSGAPLSGTITVRSDELRQVASGL